MVNLSAQAPSLDDFLPPAQDDSEKGKVAPREVEKPNQVKVETESVTENGEKTPVVKAANAQDAINAGIKEDFEQDVFLIEAGSGIGVVARGDASYSSDAKNRDARLLLKREAAVTAYARAKGNLAEFLNGLNARGKTRIDNSFDRLIDSDKTLFNTGYTRSENLNQRIDGLLRGFVTYEVKDKEKTENYEVYIVTTPKTQGKTVRPSVAMLATDNLRDGIEHVFAEIKNGLVPPVGGRIVTYPIKETGKQGLWYVGFGSAIIPSNVKGLDRQALKDLKRQAKDLAKLRAADAICGIIVGDSVMWERGSSQKTINDFKTFDTVSQEDPLGNPTESVVPVEAARRSITQVTKASNVFVSARNGRVPAGCQQTSWSTTDGDWAYHAYIYSPEATLIAKELQIAMVKGPSILEQGDRFKRPGSGDKKPGNGPAGTGIGSDKKDRPIGRLPSGRVGDDL